MSRRVTLPAAFAAGLRIARLPTMALPLVRDPLLWPFWTALDLGLGDAIPTDFLLDWGLVLADLLGLATARPDSGLPFTDFMTGVFGDAFTPKSDEAFERRSSGRGDRGERGDCPKTKVSESDQLFMAFIGVWGEEGAIASTKVKNLLTNPVFKPKMLLDAIGKSPLRMISRTTKREWEAEVRQTKSSIDWSHDQNDHKPQKSLTQNTVRRAKCSAGW